MHHRPPAARLLPLAAAATALVLAAGPAGADIQVSVRSETILRAFEQRDSDGDEANGFPGYEYLAVSAGVLEGDGFSFHGHGWGRHDFGDFYDGPSDGEILTAYGQYSWAPTNLLVRAGRQRAFAGVSNESFDGVAASTDLTPYFAASVYGGLPLSVEEVDGRSGDRLWGGRVAHRYRALYELGVSYKRVDDDGDRQSEFLAVDSSLAPPGPLSFTGYSTRSLVDDAWAEHSYEARLALEGFTLRPQFQYFRYGAYFDTGRAAAAPFSNPTGGVPSFEDSDETVTILGADASWRPGRALEVGGKVKHYDYEEAGGTAWYYSGLAALHGKGDTQVGVEAGAMDGDASEDRYTLGRGYVFWGAGMLLLSGDLVYVHYDEEINGEDRSLFASVGAGLRLLAGALTVKAAGDYSDDPYLDQAYRGTLVVEALFDR